MTKIYAVNGNNVDQTDQPDGTLIPATTEQQGSTYMATGGETLETIADQFDVSLKSLRAANPGLDPDTPLDFGVQVNIPPSSQDEPTTQPTNDGDTDGTGNPKKTGNTTTDGKKDDKKPGNGGASWMDIAKKQLGTEEIPGGRDNPQIVKYMKSINKGFNDDETPWCSGFVNWTLEKAGIKGTDSGWASSWLNWGDKVTSVKNAKPGDVVVIRTGPGKEDYHVGFFVSAKNGQVKLLGGNQRGNDPNTTGKVTYSTYSTSSIAGIRRPKT